MSSMYIDLMNICRINANKTGSRMKNIKVCTYTCRVLSRRNFSGCYIILSTWSGWRREGINAIKASTATLL